MAQYTDTDVSGVSDVGDRTVGLQLVYLSSSQLPSETANSVHVVKMCAALARQGVSVTLVADRGREFRDDPFSFYGVEESFVIRRSPLSGKLPYGLRHLVRSIFAFWVVLSARKRFRGETVVYGRDVLGLFVSRTLRIPMAVELHDLPHATEAESKRNAFRTRLTRRILHGDHLVAAVCITEALRSAIVAAEGGKVGARTVVLPHAADPPQRCEDEAWRPPDDVRVGYLGSFGPGKGLEVIEALALRLPSIPFEVFGGRSGEREYWRRRTKNVQNFTLHGFVKQAHVACSYSEFDIALAPYQRLVPGHFGDEIAQWMSPLKLFEYMSFGKAIICSDLPVLREVLDEDAAVLVSPDDIDAWHDAVIKLINDAALRARLGEAAQRRFFELHTWDDRARSILQLYRPLSRERTVQ